MTDDTQKAAQAVPDPVHLFDPTPAYKLFLGRKPVQPPAFDTPHELHRFLQRSKEFQRSPRSQKTPLGWPLAQVFVSRPAKVIYCPIGKNACTFLKTEVARTAGLQAFRSMERDIHFVTDHVRTGVQLSDYPQDRVEQLIHSDRYFKFAVLRDPADRLLSAYIEKFVIGRLAPANMHHTKSVVVPVQTAAGMMQPDFDHGISFRQFVEFIVKANPARLDPHWRPQALYLEGIAYDRFFRIDQLDALIDILEERSGMTLNRQARNVTGSGQGTARSGAADLLPAQIIAAPRIAKASFFDKETRAAVESTFALDYDLFQQT